MQLYTAIRYHRQHGSYRLSIVWPEEQRGILPDAAAERQTPELAGRVGTE